MRLERQLRFRRPESPISLSQLSALSTLAKEGAMTPGALALRERVRPPSMTRIIASLAELGFVARDADPADGRQVLVSVSRAGTELIDAERRASQEWLKRRLDSLEPDQRRTLLVVAGGVLVVQRMLASRFRARAMLGTDRRLGELEADLAGVEAPYYRVDAD